MAIRAKFVATWYNANMIKLIHLGTGGTHSKQVGEEIKRVNRIRECRLSNTPNIKGAYTVVLSDKSKNVLTLDVLKTILARDSVSFVVGDSNGIPEHLMKAADEVYTLTAVPTTHQLQALILAEALSTSIMQMNHDSKTPTS